MNGREEREAEREKLVRPRPSASVLGRIVAEWALQLIFNMPADEMSIFAKRSITALWHIQPRLFLLLIRAPPRGSDARQAVSY